MMSIRSLWLGVVMALISIQAFSQTSHMVDVTNNVFTPDELTIAPGDTVVWVNSQGNHNVNGTQATFPSNPESFGNEVGAGWTFRHVFTIPGSYDYRCDPHFSVGMVGKIEVQGLSAAAVTLNLTGMSPHLGQEIYFALIEASTGEVIDRISETVEESFSVVLSGVESGSSYYIDFFADHNGNGYYDAPPTDHAWRLELPDATGSEVLNFEHNTDFIDIQWKHRLRVRFDGMNPHLGQMLTLYVYDIANGIYIDTVVVPSIEEAKFDVESNVLEPMGSYRVDFYADFNGNGSYDAPPADHAWSLEPGVVTGDVDLEFTHNTDFTDIFATTGLVDREGDLGLSVYPNPADDYVTIEAESEIISVHLYDARGSVVRNLKEGRTRWVKLSLDGIEPGVYFLEIRSLDQQIKISRLLKQ